MNSKFFNFSLISYWEIRGILVFFIFFFGCEAKKQNTENNQKLDFREIKPKYAKLYTILEGNEYHILRIFDYDKNQKLKNQQDFYLYTKKPKKEKNAIKIPLQNLAVCSHTHLACVDLLGENKKVKGLTESSFLAEEFWQKQVADKNVVEIGKNGVFNTEIILKTNPQIILTSNFDLSATDKNVNTLIQAGIQFLPNLEWLENHPLGRAEWIKVFGYLLDKTTEANKIFENIEKNYLKYKEIAHKKSTEKSTKKPNVMMGLPYQGVWYVAGGKSFMGQFLRDAGASYHWDNDPQTASIALNFEQIYQPLSKADIWLNVGMASDKKSVFDTDLRLSKLPNAQKIRIFNPKQNPKGGSLYLTKGVIEPDKVLKDFIKICYPEHTKDLEFTYYQELK